MRTWGIYDKSLDKCDCTTWTIPQYCKHLNGWYGNVKFLFWKRPIYCCTDCGEFLYGKRLKEFKNR